MQSTNWFKKRYYTHFTPRILEENKIRNAKNVITEPNYVARHAFYPLLHKTIKERKYKKIKDSTGEVIGRNHKYDDGKEWVSTAKKREIFYAAHLDSHIYSYYAKHKLGILYEAQVKRAGKEFSESICAYRRIELEGTKKGKSNIHFAKEVFDHIKTTEQCAVLTFDIKSFFDSLDHKIIKKVWKDLLDVDELQRDHYRIYKSLVKYKYVELSDLLQKLNLKSERILRRRGVTCLFENSKKFREVVIKGGLIKSNPFTNNEGKPVGIPQGTPMSAFLANLYMLEFDKEIFNMVNQYENGLYRRYSDDILVVCPVDVIDKVKEFVFREIEKVKLIIQPEKTEQFIFSKSGTTHAIYGLTDKGELVENMNLKYLGFEFDGVRVSIKHASLSKYYRELKRSVKSKYYWARKSVLKERLSGIKQSKIHRSKLYKRFSHFKNCYKRINYYKYAQNATEIMEQPEIKRQLKAHFKILEETIERYERKLNEVGDKKYQYYLEKKNRIKAE